MFPTTSLFFSSILAAALSLLFGFGCFFFFFFLVVLVFLCFSFFFFFVFFFFVLWRYPPCRPLWSTALFFNAMSLHLAFSVLFFVTIIAPSDPVVDTKSFCPSSGHRFPTRVSRDGFFFFSPSFLFLTSPPVVSLFLVVPAPFNRRFFTPRLFAYLYLFPVPFPITTRSFRVQSFSF